MQKSLAKYGYLFMLMVLVAVITAAGYIFVQQQNQIVIEEARLDLAAIADLKLSQIVQWRKERLLEATSLYSNTMISHRIKDYLIRRETSGAFKEIQGWMANLQRASGYSNLILFRPNGDVLISASTITTNLAVDRKLISTVLQKKEVFLSDLHIHEGGGEFDINLFIPIMDPEGSTSDCIAVIAFYINPLIHLYPLLRTWPTPSRTGETLLVRNDGEDVLFLNELRFRDKSALTLREPLSQKNRPAVRASLGQEGVFEGLDYRGVNVIAAVRTVPDSPWAIVCKVDNLEVLEPVSKRIWYVVGTCILIVQAAGMTFFMWFKRKQEVFLRRQYETELKFSRGLKQAEQSLQDANNFLEARVATRTEELSNTNIKLRQEIAERKQLEDKLFQSRKLETIGQIAGGVAHEVRNPLNAILSISEALFREKEIEANPEFAPYIQHIRTQVNRLANLMNDLLDLGKPISADNLQVVSLLELCRETMELWKVSGLADNRQGVLTADEGAAVKLVTADSSKLQQVIFNLLENAGHHSPAESTIILHLAETVPDSGMAVVRIIDSGKGIPEESLSRVFEPFYSNRRGGTGLGLSLVKHFIENMGGSVRIWNNIPPPGCTAELCILLAVKEHT